MPAGAGVPLMLEPGSEGLDARGEGGDGRKERRGETEGGGGIEESGGAEGERSKEAVRGERKVGEAGALEGARAPPRVPW